MKSIKTMSLICVLAVFNACQAQEREENLSADKKEIVVSKDTMKQMNLLDEQVKMFGGVFELMGAGADSPLGSATNYRELLEEMELPSEQKKELRELYELYDMSLDPKKKKEFEARWNKKSEEGMRRATIEN